MTDLLTLNGIPPQVVGAISAEQRITISKHTKNRSNKFYMRGQKHPTALNPFGNYVRDIVNSFIKWGAEFTGENYNQHIRFHAKDVKKGDPFFIDDAKPHFDSDPENPLSQINAKDILDIRILCTSSDPACFADLTPIENRSKILARYKDDETEGGRYLYPALFDDTPKLGGRIITPEVNEIIVFDSMTPHAPKMASIENRRVLLNAWAKVKLPRDWRKRVENGDVPRLPSPGQNL